MTIKFTFNIDQKRRRKCLIASAPIYPAEIIYREQPLVCQYKIENDMFDNHFDCQFCLTPLESAEENASRLTNEQIRLPFSDCCTTDKTKHVSCSCNEKYCSNECRRQAYQHYHRILCPMEELNLKKDIKSKIEKLVNFWKENQNQQASFILLLIKIISRIKHDSEFANELKQLSENKENYVDKFTNKIFGDNVEEKIDHLKLLIAEIINIDVSTEYFLTNPGLKSLITLIKMFTIDISTSAFDEWADNCQRSENEETNDLIDNIYKKIENHSGLNVNKKGIGLFKVLEYLEHDCESNAKICFIENNSTMTIKALRSINVGEEIKVFLIDESLRYRSRHTRIKYMQKTYFSDCNCLKCERQINDPDCTSDENSDSDLDLDY